MTLRTASEPAGILGGARRSARVVFLALAFGATLSSPAFAQGLLVSPTRIAAEVRAGDRLPPIELTNRSRETLAVRVDVAPAGQELSGLPRFDLSRSSLRRGRRLARPSVRRLRLAPGQTRRVVVTVGRPVRDRVGVYGVVAFTARVATRAQERGSVVTPSVRLSTNLLLRYPGRLRRTGRATALRVEQGPKRTLRFLGRMRNDGNIHVRPETRLTVRSVGGEVLVRRAFPLENVLPGFERELVFDLKKLLTAGRYLASVEARIGGRRSVQSAGFRLVGPNLLPTPDLEIAALDPPAPDAGEAFEVRVAVRNSGTAALGATGGLALTPAAGGRRLVGARFDVPVLGPGDSTVAKVALPPLDEGSYALTARLRDRDRVLSERTVVFSTDTRPGLLTRILDWMAAHVPLLLALFAGVLLLGAAAAASYIRRLRRQARAAS